jgi:hypothetical protein
MELERQSAGTLNYILPLQLAITVNGLLIRFFILLSGGLLLFSALGHPKNFSQ